MSQADAIALLSSIYETLDRQSDLSPDNEQVNICLRRLVATLKSWHATGFGHDLADHPGASAVAHELPRLCGEAECKMEKWWALRILASNCPGAQALGAFWYKDGYEALMQAELDLLAGDASDDFVFLGSGALPLTAILIAQARPRAHITCVDRDGEACALAHDLIARFGLAGRVAVVNSGALDHRPHPYETVICASLLDAPGLFDHLYASGTRRLVLRDAEGAYRFCYRPARQPCNHFAERARSSLSALRINTSIYFEAISA